MHSGSFRQRVASNTLIQIVGKLSGTLLSLIAAGIIFRYLGDHGFGQYTTILSIVQIFGTLMDLGLYVLLIKKLASPHEPKEHINALFTLRIISGCIFLGCAPITGIILSLFSPLYSLEIIIGIACASAFAFGISINQLLSAVFQKNFASRWIAFGEIISKVALLIGVWLVGVWNLGLLGIVCALSASTLLSTAFLYALSRTYTRMRWYWNTQVMRELMLEAWPVAVSVALVLLYFRGDIIILSLFEKSQTPIGIYGAPYKLLEVLITFPAMFTGLMLSPITHAWKTRDAHRVSSLFQHATDAIALLAFPIVAGLMAVAEPIMHMIAGRAFTESASILQILSLATGGIFFGTLFGYVVVAIDKQKAMMWAYGAIAISALTLYMIVIPRWSIHGAAWVTVYSEVSVMLLAYLILKKHLNVSLRWGVMIKAGCSAIVMGMIVHWAWPHFFTALRSLEARPFLHDSVTVIFAIGIGVIVYAALLFGLKATSLPELKRLMTK